MILIINDYKGLLGYLKGIGEKACPRLMDQFFMPVFYKLLDVFYQRHCKNRLREDLLNDEFRLFKNIEIETINRCNGSCSFCPVNKKEDQRPFQLMEETLFFRIIDQLAEMNYTGSVALYSNNEPLLDKRIERFAEYTRYKLPTAILYLDTNGTLLSRERFRRLMEFLDYMTIDNYQDDMKFIPTVQELLPEIETPEYQDKVYVCLRK